VRSRLARPPANHRGRRRRGHPDEKLANLFERGIGVSNVNERLQVLYGDDYKMWVDSRLNEGTTTASNLPEQTGVERVVRADGNTGGEPQGLDGALTFWIVLKTLDEGPQFANIFHRFNVQIVAISLSPWPHPATEPPDREPSRHLVLVIGLSACRAQRRRVRSVAYRP